MHHFFCFVKLFLPEGHKKNPGTLIFFVFLRVSSWLKLAVRGLEESPSNKNPGGRSFSPGARRSGRGRRDRKK
jgi:hypothetical protein